MVARGKAGSELRSAAVRRERLPAAHDRLAPAEVDVGAVGPIQAHDVDDRPLAGTKRLRQLAHRGQRCR